MAVVVMPLLKVVDRQACSDVTADRKETLPGGAIDPVRHGVVPVSVALLDDVQKGHMLGICVEVTICRERARTVHPIRPLGQ